MDIELRAWDGEYMSYQGEPDLETIQSLIFHYGDSDLMLYSGFKDKNGNKIYEGDILSRYRYSRGKTYKSNYGLIVVKFENGAFNIKPRLLDRLEIIGNIYENSELINNIK